MTGKEKGHALLTLALLLIHLPLIIQTPQLLYSTVETVDPSLVSAGTATVATLAIVDIDSKPKEQPPHPQQGGCRITAQYLKELPDTEAQWAFWYVT